MTDHECALHSWGKVAERVGVNHFLHILAMTQAIVHSCSAREKTWCLHLDDRGVRSAAVLNMRCKHAMLASSVK